MLSIINIITPIFLLVGVGYLAVQRQIISRQQVAGLGQFVILFALPALVLKALLERPLHEFTEVNYLLAYGGGSMLVFWLAYAVARWGRRDSLAASALTGLGSSVSNSGFIGYPIVAMVIGPTAVLALALCMLVENLLMIPMALAMAELHESRAGQFNLWRTLGQILGGLLRKPLIQAMIAGVLMSGLDIRPPAFVMKAVEMLAQASAPVAIFVIGASLQGLRDSQLMSDIVRVSLTKLIFHPLVVLLLFYLWPVSPEWRTAGVLFAAAPMMSIYPIIGQRFGLEERCAATLVVTTLAAFFSLALFIGLLG